MGTFLYALLVEALWQHRSDMPGVDVCDLLELSDEVHHPGPAGWSPWPWR